MIYRTKKEVRLALARLAAALPSMLKDDDTFHDQFERRAEGILRNSPPAFEEYIYERLRALVVARDITPRRTGLDPRED